MAGRDLPIGLLDDPLDDALDMHRRAVGKPTSRWRGALILTPMPPWSWSLSSLSRYSSCGGGYRHASKWYTCRLWSLPKRPLQELRVPANLHARGRTKRAPTHFQIFDSKEFPEC